MSLCVCVCVCVCVCLSVSAAQYISVFSSFHTVSLQDVYAPVRRIIQSQTNPGRSGHPARQKTNHAPLHVSFSTHVHAGFFLFFLLFSYSDCPISFFYFIYLFICFKVGPGLDAETFFGK